MTDQDPLDLSALNVKVLECYMIVGKRIIRISEQYYNHLVDNHRMAVKVYTFFDEECSKLRLICQPA